MPRNNHEEGMIRVTLLGVKSSMLRVQVPANASVEIIKTLWCEEFDSKNSRETDDDDLHLQYHCLFDGFLCEDQASMVGLGVVDGDTLYIFTDKTEEQGAVIKYQKRTAEEISVGLNVLFGEEENLTVRHNDNFSVENHGHGQCFSLTDSLLEKVFDAEIRTLFSEDTDYDRTLKQLKDSLLNHVYSEGNILTDVELSNMIIKTLVNKDQPRLDTTMKKVYEILLRVRDMCLIPPEFENINYGTVFIGPSRNAGINNYLAFPPTVQLSGVNWKTTLRDLIESYREYSNFDIPGEDEDLFFNNTAYGVEERVFDVYVDALFKLPFLPTYLHFSFQFDVSCNEDLRCVDDLVSFIEGDEAGSSDSKSKKKKKRKKKNQQHETLEEGTTNKTVSKKNEEDIENKLEDKLIEVETMFDDLNDYLDKMKSEKARIESEIKEEETKIEKQEQVKSSMKQMQEKDSQLSRTIFNTESELNNISDGILSCDSEIHALQMRLKRVSELRTGLANRKKDKLDKLKILDDEKRGLAAQMMLNSETSRNFEEKHNSLNKIQKLREQLSSVEVSLESMNKAKTCKDLLENLESMMSSCGLIVKNNTFPV